jgi:hypothetical protein
VKQDLSYQKVWCNKTVSIQLPVKLPKTTTDPSVHLFGLSIWFEKPSATKDSLTPDSITRCCIGSDVLTDPQIEVPLHDPKCVELPGGEFFRSCPPGRGTNVYTFIGDKDVAGVIRPNGTHPAHMDAFLDAKPIRCFDVTNTLDIVNLNLCFTEDTRPQEATIGIEVFTFTQSPREVLVSVSRPLGKFTYMDNKVEVLGIVVRSGSSLPVGTNLCVVLNNHKTLFPHTVTEDDVSSGLPIYLLDAGSSGASVPVNVCYVKAEFGGDASRPWPPGADNVVVDYLFRMYA